MIIAVDPGSMKCGIAVLDKNTHVVEKKLIEKENLINEVSFLAARYAVSTVVIGEGTGSKNLKKRFSEINLPFDVIFIPENFSTLEARTRYFKENPPIFFLRFLPKKLLVPPRPIDDYAAIILGERYLKEVG